MTRPLYAGFDLGTSNSAAATFDGEAVTVIRNGAGAAITPSIVRVDAQARVTVGARARRMLETDPDNTASEFKRLMGTDRRIAFPAAGVEKSPAELSAAILTALRDDVRAQLGVEVARAVISVPALFELPQSAATSEAARLAGFERVELIPEPVASALAAGWTAEDAGDRAWLVYDLGGGTFDASLLETRDGLLRVVGHDGDNFLGGRDLDWAITEHLAARLAQDGGPRLSRKDPAHTSALRLLRAAAEEAKVELSRQERAAVSLPQPLVIDGRELVVDVELTRAEVERLAAPIIDRSLEVCARLLAAHGQSPDQLARVVLVGGPTVMPLLRARVAERLGAPLAEGLDPMTLVAQGAAIYAATAGLDARPTAPAVVTRGATATATVWLQHPAVSADLTPHVIGRFVGEGPRPATVTLSRDDGAWRGPTLPVGADGGFVGTVSLLARKRSTFTLTGADAAGAVVEIQPSGFAILQGVTIGDPPLARTVGVALASDHVQPYLERGTPLPARRTFTHRAVETVARGADGSALAIPIVQGEFHQAHLCRLVGTLEVRGADLTATVPSGSPIDVTIELDRGGRLTARALVPATGQVFEHVVHLLVPEATPTALDLALAEMRTHLSSLRADAFRHGLASVLDKLERVEVQLASAELDIDAAHGGDADAAQKARRTLLDVDALLAEADLVKKWPELDDHARRVAIGAAEAVSMHGTEAERRLLDEVVAAMNAARAGRDAAELERQVRLAQRLATSASQRSPDTWEWYFEHAASEVASATDLPRAEALVQDGKAAVARGDHDRLRHVVKQLWALLPPDAADRRRGFDSGVR